MNNNSKRSANNQLVNIDIEKCSRDRQRILKSDPTSIQTYLLERQARYKQLDGQQYLISKNYKKKVIQVHETQPIKKRIGELIGVLFGENSIKMARLQSVPKLNQIASKLCQTIQPQMRKQIKFRPDTCKILRQLLESDPTYSYPNNVSCLVSLGFDQPYEDIMNLLVDDGVVSRANRKALMDPNMRYVGLATINRQADPYLRCTVIVLTDKIIQRSQNNMSRIVSESDKQKPSQYSFSFNMQSKQAEQNKQKNRQQQMMNNQKQGLMQKQDGKYITKSPQIMTTGLTNGIKDTKIREQNQQKYINLTTQQLPAIEQLKSNQLLNLKMRELSETKNNPSAQGIGNPSARTIGKLNPIDKLVANQQSIPKQLNPNTHNSLQIVQASPPIPKQGLKKQNGVGMNLQSPLNNQNWEEEVLNAKYPQKLINQPSLSKYVSIQSNLSPQLGRKQINYDKIVNKKPSNLTNIPEHQISIYFNQPPEPNIPKHSLTKQFTNSESMSVGQQKLLQQQKIRINFNNGSPRSSFNVMNNSINPNQLL